LGDLKKSSLSNTISGQSRKIPGLIKFENGALLVLFPESQFAGLKVTFLKPPEIIYRKRKPPFNNLLK